MKGIFSFLLICCSSVFSSYSQTRVTKAAFSKYCDTSFVKMTRYNMLAFRDHNAALQCAKKMTRPVLMYFSDSNCVNCGKIEAMIMKNRELRDAIEKNYVLADLPCDDPTPVPVAKQYFSKALNSKVVTKGGLNAAIQADTYNLNSQPFFIVLSKDGKELASQPYTTDLQEFMATLKKGIGK